MGRMTAGALGQILVRVITRSALSSRLLMARLVTWIGSPASWYLLAQQSWRQLALEPMPASQATRDPPDGGHRLAAVVGRRNLTAGEEPLLPAPFIAFILRVACSRSSSWLVEDRLLDPQQHGRDQEGAVVAAMIAGNTPIRESFGVINSTAKMR